MDFSCNICTETFFNSKDIFSTKCGHVFHQICLRKWLDKSKTCPDCRSLCIPRQIFQLYLTFDSSLMGVVLNKKIEDNREEVEKTKQEIHEKISEIFTTQNCLVAQKESVNTILEQLELEQNANQKLSEKVKSLKKEKNYWTIWTFENIGKFAIVTCIFYFIFSVVLIF